MTIPKTLQGLVDKIDAENSATELLVQRCEDIAYDWSIKPGLTDYARTTGAIADVLNLIDGNDQLPQLELMTLGECTVNGVIVEEGASLNDEMNMLTPMFMARTKFRLEAATQSVEEETSNE